VGDFLRSVRRRLQYDEAERFFPERGVCEKQAALVGPSLPLKQRVSLKLGEAQPSVGGATLSQSLNFDLLSFSSPLSSFPSNHIRPLLLDLLFHLFLDHQHHRAYVCSKHSSCWDACQKHVFVWARLAGKERNVELNEFGEGG